MHTCVHTGLIGRAPREREEYGRLLLDLALLKRVPDRDEPLDPPRRKELALRIQRLLLADLVESAIEDVPRRILRRRSPFSDRTPARRTELTVQERTGPVVGRVLLRSAAREVEGGQWDFGRDPVRAAGEFCRANVRNQLRRKRRRILASRSDLLLQFPQWHSEVLKSSSFSTSTLYRISAQ